MKRSPISLATISLFLLLVGCSNEQVALQAVKIGAKFGNSNAIYELGLYYQDNKQFEKATQSFLKAANLGEIRSQLELGDKYLIERDFKKSVYWFKKAAEEENQWVFLAEWKLGIFYGFGLGVEKDIEKSLEFLRKAKKHGMDECDQFFKKEKELGFDLAIRNQWPGFTTFVETPVVPIRKNHKLSL